jgi:hypothetical protein
MASEAGTFLISLGFIGTVAISILFGSLLDGKLRTMRNKE